MPRIVTSAYVTPGTACLIAHLAASAEISERAMAARAGTPPIRCSGASAFTWMDQGLPLPPNRTRRSRVHAGR
jgi:hypothetical protein